MKRSVQSALRLGAQGIKIIESKMDKSNERLAELTKQANTLAAQKKKLPANLLEEVSLIQKKIAALEADLALRKVQSDAIRVKFESDKQRFRELKGASPPSQ